MATVTRKFKDDFETWAAHRIEAGDWTPAEMEEFRGTIRQDLAPGPDLLRAGLVVIVGGVEVPAAIEDHEERYRLWADFFAAEADSIRNLTIRSEAKR
jgi:hypothetical protein